MSRKVFLATIAASAVIVTAAAQAQQETAGESGLQEVIVTAQKRSENVQDVPKTVNVVQPEDLELAGASQLTDLPVIAPSVAPAVSGQFPGQRSFAMRGISTLPISQNLPAQVGIVLDDVPQPTWSSIANELSDVERVEVLPGPQSTLSGRNAAAGLINIVTRSPSMQSWTGNVIAEQTDDSQTKVNAFLSGPLAPGLGFSLSAFEDKWDGNVKNLELGDTLNGMNTRGARAKLKYEASDNLRISASFYSQFTSMNDVGGATTTGAQPSGAIVYANPAAKVVPNFDTTPAASKLTIGALEPGVTIGPDNNSYDSQRHSTALGRDIGGSFRIDYDFSFATLSSITSVANSYQEANADFVAIDVPVSNANRFAHLANNSQNVVQEVRLNSQGEGPLTYTIGYIYSDLSLDYDYFRALAPVDWYRTSETQSNALYARATWEFLPSTSLTGGFRYQADNLKYDWQFLPRFTGVSMNNADSASYSFPSGEASLQHKFFGALTGYVTFSHAESGEAYDTEDNSTAQTGAHLKPLASEKVNNVEFGAKSEWFDRKLIVNADLYHADYRNFPVQTFYLNAAALNSVPVFKTLDAGKVTTQGVELDVTAVPVTNLRLEGNVAYTDAYFASFPAATCYKLETAAQGCVAGSNGTNVQPYLSGSPLPYSSKWKLNLSSTYKVPLPSLPFDAEFGAFYRYQSRTQYDPLGNPLTVQQGFGIANLTTSIRNRDSDWSVDLFVNNVADKHYYTSLVDSQFWTNHVIIANLPRDWSRYMGVRVRAGF